MVYAMENNWLERFRAEYKPLLKDKYDEFEYGLSCPKARHIRMQSSRNVDYLTELGYTQEIINAFKLAKKRFHSDCIENDWY